VAVGAVVGSLRSLTSNDGTPLNDPATLPIAGARAIAERVLSRLSTMPTGYLAESSLAPLIAALPSDDRDHERHDGGGEREGRQHDEELRERG
jgi:hypothetical protein